LDFTGHLVLFGLVSIFLGSHPVSAATATNASYNVRAGTRTNVVVAADGSGDFKSVQEGIQATATGTANQPVIVRIKPGNYRELIYVQREKRFLHLIGGNPTNTILTYDLNANLPGPGGRPIGTFRTPSTCIDADDFTAENITFENSAGPVGQALAIRLDGDRLAFRNCRFLGWQDTILDNRGRHYFENCYIAGHVDFIFGAGTSWFEKCHIHCLRDGYITAASTPEGTPFGFVFSACRVTGETPEVKTFLGRPWRVHASVMWLDSEMSAAVRPAGWDNWRDPAREKTVRYAEFRSAGPGGDRSNRVAWSTQLTAEQAKEITVARVLGGEDSWQPRQSF
jgi:pectinesterase